MQALTASWAGWVAAYEQHCKALPGPTHTVCPNCGADELRVMFAGRTERRTGYAAFWCEGCLVGIHLGRCAVPEGAAMESLDTPVEQRAVRVPNYTMLWPDEAE
ncbi:hypothetical protein GA0115240_10798 [Streptomyces sp. DvalAA-14]|uniref:hypothetical protein n=1 Tax=unclassified Streptomyces TaxID=2593676 RepID=UPI00081B5283|nr:MULTISPECIES: hypothetical protein [unclassified Streptomyces]MYS19405.1 hypothetical protein [Streptomyces sp. SID4948]SCD43709.1 hypothetical protein GA0115240_10798 [Streptomyces sp. DvalAA-14]